MLDFYDLFAVILARALGLAAFGWLITVVWYHLLKRVWFYHKLTLTTIATAYHKRYGEEQVRADLHDGLAD
jgi:hypothetical protein